MFTLVAREWKNKRFDPNLLDLFNITLPCKDRCAFDIFEPLECERKGNVLKLSFNIRSTDENSQYLTAIPFTIIQSNTESLICTMNYKGPKRLFFNKTAGCIVPVLDDTDDDTLLTSIIRCKAGYDARLNNLWGEPVCQTMPSILEHSVIQVKITTVGN